MLFDNLLTHLKTPGQHRFHARIRDDHILDPGYQSGPIAPNAAYFEIRLAEMFLSYRSEYGRSFVPLAVTATEFAYGGKSQNFPFLVGNDMLSDLNAYVKGQDVRFHNSPVVGPVPYAGGDVAVFVGLYRAQVDDFARKLLEVLGQMAGVFDFSKLSNYVNVAGKLADGLYSLLNFKQIEYRIGDRDVFQDHGTNLFAAGYFAYANCDETAVNAGDLWVQDGILKHGSAQGSLQSFKDHDYCLMQVQRSIVRNDYTSLPFHGKWKQARERISQGDYALAHTLFIECCQQIADSPDLTPANAEALIQVYQANFAKDMEFYGKLRMPPSAVVPPAYRSTIAGRTVEPRQSIMGTAQAAVAAGVAESTVQDLVELSENWNLVPHVASPEVELTDAFLNQQVGAIASFAKQRTPNPKGLANALAIASVTASTKVSSGDH